MPGYKDMLELIGQGKSPKEILEILSVAPSKLRRMLRSKRLNSYLEAERDVSRKLAAQELLGGLHRMVRRCREIAENGRGDTARKAAEGLLDQAKGRLEKTPSQELLVSLVRAGKLPRSVLFEKCDNEW